MRRLPARRQRGLALDRRDDRGASYASRDGLTLAIEVVLVQFLFLGFGYWLDQRLGTGPLLTVVLGVLALVGNVARLYYGYAASMAAEEEGKPWARRS
jgi:hypothetical protein